MDSGDADSTSVIVAILAGFFAWVGFSWKARLDNKQRLGRLLTKLLLLHSNVQVLLAASELFKSNAKDWKEYEYFRKYISNSKFLEGPVDEQSLYEIVNDVAASDPVLAVKLSSLVEILAGAKKASLSESSKSAELYMSLLSVHEVGIENSSQELRKICFKVALRYSLLTAIKVFFYFRKGQKGRSRNEDFFAKFSASAFSLMREMSADTRDNGKE
jgi:hypothetical protein